MARDEVWCECLPARCLERNEYGEQRRGREEGRGGDGAHRGEDRQRSRDRELAGRMIRDICYGNARAYLGLPDLGAKQSDGEL